MLAFALVAAIAGTAPAQRPVQSQESRRQLRLNASGMFALASNAEGSGQIQMAENAYRALAQDSDVRVRSEAMFRHGKLLLKTGRLQEAAVLLRQVVDARPSAGPPRLELARALQLMGDADAAWREVRAVQASGLPIEVARMVDRYSEALRASRPFGTSIQVALAPDTNINAATGADTLGTVFGDFDIDAASKARSGLGLALTGQAYRRFSWGSRHSLLARVSGSANLYRRTDFNDFTMDAAAGPELQFGSNRLTLEAGLSQRWYGMEPAVRSMRVAASLRKPLGRKSQLQASAYVGHLDYKLNDLQDATSIGGRLGVERALSPTTGIGVNLTGGRLSARDSAYSTRDWRIGLIGWRDVGRATLTAEAEYGRLKADERLALLPEARSDRYTRFALGASFRQLTFGGFAPFTRLVIERNKSTVEFYDYRRRRSELGVSRAF